MGEFGGFGQKQFYIYLLSTISQAAFYISTLMISQSPNLFINKVRRGGKSPLDEDTCSITQDFLSSIS